MTSGGNIRIFPRRSVLREAGLLLLITLILTVLSWGLRPPRLPLRADVALYKLDLDFSVVTPAEAVALYDANSRIFVDTRSRNGRTRRIPGALDIRQASFEEDLLAVFDFLTPDDPLLLFGDGNLILMSAVASRLQEKGYTDLVFMSGGLDDWAAAGGETAEARHD